ncbi:hypothetical protein AB4068_15595 [Arthrobacter sp. 2RAF22]|uniref:hypothetical protein n=1 Tax=Arthrobacter sp. 2RAF22 TaxID=3232996 RepID=UPI003F9088C8
MTRSLFLKAGNRARTARPAVRAHKPVPDYEKPLVKTGEARLWRTLNRGDRVEVIHNGNYSRTGIIDDRIPDGSTIWIILDQGLGRIAVTQGDPAALVLIE